MAEIYYNRTLLLWLATFAVGALLLRIKRNGRQAPVIFGGVLMSLPFLWSIIYLLLDKDSSERAERLLAVWPFAIVISLVLALLTVRRRCGVKLMLPFVLIGTVNGAFLSQQLWGSTFAIWPLLMLLIACAVAKLRILLQDRTMHIVKSSPELNRIRQARGRPAAPVTLALISMSTLVAISLLVSGAFYIKSHERLEYANLDDGHMTRAKLTALRGLSMRGSWLPDFEELVRFTDKNIPRNDGILMIPGEDLFYYTTGRHPRFPALMFDHTINPYSPEEIVAEVRARNIRWLVIKNDIQLEEEPVENKKHLLELLGQDFEHTASLNNYEIYRR